LDAENPQVALYFLQDKIEVEDNSNVSELNYIDRMTELSGLILDLLKRAYDTVCIEFWEDNVSGESIEWKSFASMVLL